MNDYMNAIEQLQIYKLMQIMVIIDLRWNR